jgi:hypothetical protein
MNMADIPLMRFNPARDAAGITEGTPPQPGTLSVTPAGAVGLPVGIAIVLALLGAIQPLVSSFVSTKLQERQDAARVRSAEAASQAAWLRSVLSVQDDKKREIAVKFLVKAGLVNDAGNALINLKAEEIPFVAPATPADVQGIKNQSPPRPE